MPCLRIAENGCGKVGSVVTSIRIMVVDDFEPFRKLIFSTLEKELGLEDIFVACDGEEAIKLAAELQPHLIVLDIGLPRVNGLQAARRIRQFAPKAKLLFVSQESLAEIVREAFKIGASGYVLKNDMAELPTAVMRVLSGEKFVSRSLAGYSLPFLDFEES